MSKRFTDTTKWKRVWFRKLKPEHKVFWFYLLDQCCHAGIWEVDFEQAEFFCGKLVESEIREVFKKQILEFDNGKRWFIQDFIDFQYGELNDKVNAHRSAINRLKKFKLYNIDEPLIKSSLTLDSRVKDKDKDKDKDKVNNKRPKNLNEVKAYFKEKGINVDAEKFFDYYESQGWKKANGRPVVNWKRCISTWKTDEKPEEKKVQIVLACPNHPEITKKTTDKNLFTFCPKCRERLIDIETIKYKQVVQRPYGSD
ncbi:MAG: hypothetical protein Tp1111SUR768151_25 [Prokaryotic dsDNA virus sp.]|nr:MAG: hypothetical protein Tp1111SUR768151_25 [Prokaryotic dsDNA virus sp.]|tara:strand:+ start:3225 stop:3989 length:765 start_codon:yes stop_codon:yes gene_type:complete